MKRDERHRLVAESVESHDLDAGGSQFEARVQSPYRIAEVGAERSPEGLRRRRVAHAEAELRFVGVLAEAVPRSRLRNTRQDTQVRSERETHGRRPVRAPVAQLQFQRILLRAAPRGSPVYRRAWPTDHSRGGVVNVEEGPPRPRRVDELAVPRPSDDPDGDGSSPRSPHDDAIVSVVQIQTDLARLTGVERAHVVPRAAAPGQLQGDRSVALALHSGDVGLISGLHVHRSGQECVVAVRHLAQVVPSPFERPCQPRPIPRTFPPT